MINGLDLFSGYGGITIALQDWVIPVAYCEINCYAQHVLLSRMSEGKLPMAPIWDDITTFSSETLPNIDIIYGGFPCQDISIAGNGKGLSGDRSGLIKEMFRLLEETKATLLFLENVPAIRTRGGESISKELAKRGYGHRWCCISASDVGAPHKRERWFCLAYSRRKLKRSKKESKRTSSNIARCFREWDVEPDVDRVANGVAFRVDRIKALGNGVVPTQAKKAFEILMFGIQ